MYVLCQTTHRLKYVRKNCMSRRYFIIDFITYECTACGFSPCFFVLTVLIFKHPQKGYHVIQTEVKSTDAVYIFLSVKRRDLQKVAHIGHVFYSELDHRCDLISTGSNRSEIYWIMLMKFVSLKIIFMPYFKILQISNWIE